MGNPKSLSSFCFSGTAVGGGDGEWGDGDLEMDVEYPADDGVGELPLELEADGCGETALGVGSPFPGTESGARGGEGDRERDPAG